MNQPPDPSLGIKVWEKACWFFRINCLFFDCLIDMNCLKSLSYKCVLDRSTYEVHYKMKHLLTEITIFILFARACVLVYVCACLCILNYKICKFIKLYERLSYKTTLYPVAQLNFITETCPYFPEPLRADIIYFWKNMPGKN